MRANLIILLFLILCGCQSSKPTVMATSSKLPPRVYGSSDLRIVKTEQMLAAKGVKVIIIGQMYMLSVPTHLIFFDESPRIKWQSYALLNDIAGYLRLFRKVSLNVIAYNDCYLSKERTRALTLERSRVVANYLWSQDIKATLLFTRGMGNDKPIVARAKCSDTSPNSRLEIIFRRVIV